jgi:hypothetical protein
LLWKISLTTSFRAAGAVGVTVPTCWYLLSNAPDTSHGHGDHGDAHGESHGEEHEEPKESKDEGETSEDAEEKGEESDKSEDPDSEDETKDADTPDTSDDEGEDDSGDAKKTSPDAKGGIKKREESTKSTKAGETGAEVCSNWHPP